MAQVSHEMKMTSSDLISWQAMQEDTQLVKASQQGDQDAFAFLVQKHQHRIFVMNLHMLQYHEDAKEITQEAFLAAWRGLASFRGEACFLTWLSRITYHCCLRRLARRKRERSVQEALQAEQLLEVMDKEQQTEAVLEQRDWQGAVREQMEQLPARYRIVLILRHLQEMTYEEMADILSVPIGTIKTQLFRARSLLKERLLAQHLRVSVSQK